MRRQVAEHKILVRCGMVGMLASATLGMMAAPVLAAPEPAGASGVVATGLIPIAPTPNVSCPPTDQSGSVVGPINLGIVSLAVLNVACTSKPTLNAADASVADFTVLGVEFSAVSSHCYATTDIDPGSSSLVSVNGTPYVSRNVRLSFAGFRVILNETIVSNGQLTQNAVHIVVPRVLGTPGQDIVIAQTRCRMPTG